MPYSYKALKDIVKDGVQCLVGSTVVFEEETEWEAYLEPINPIDQAPATKDTTKATK